MFSKHLWKNRWLEVKGVYWESDCFRDNLRILYNCFVEVSLLNPLYPSIQDISWINQQICFCCKEIIDSLTSDESLNEVFITCSVTDVLSAYNCCSIALTKRSDEEAVLIEFHRIGLCLGIVWLTNEVELFQIQSLYDICLKQEQLLKNINPELTSLAKMLFRFGNNLNLPSTAICANEDCTVDEVNSLCGCHSSFLYLFLVLLYNKKQFITLINAASTSSKAARCDQTTCLIHNIVACSYYKLSKPLMAIVFWRKAVESCQKYFYLLPILYNLFSVYKKCNMHEPATEIAQELMLLINQNEVVTECDDSVTPYITIQIENGDMKLKAFAKQYSADISNLIYHFARYFMMLNKEFLALPCYERFLSLRKIKFDPSRSVRTIEYQLPVSIPSISQITAEYALCLTKCNHIEKLFEMEFADLLYCSAAFTKAQKKIVFASSEVEPCLTDKKNFTITAMHLYHCLTTHLYKISCIMNNDYTKAMEEIENCLQAIETVQPSIYDPNQAVEYNDDQQHSLVLHYLSRAKAMLHFNLAMVLISTAKKEEKVILKALQSVLRFDNKNIDTRWNVTLLLWKLDQREEAIKTWCKTRSINYKLDYKEIKSIQNDKLSDINTCQSTNRKCYLQKDIHILNELLRMIAP